MNRPVLKYLLLLLSVFALSAVAVLPAVGGFPQEAYGVNIDLIPDEILIEFDSGSNVLRQADMANNGALYEVARMTYRPVGRFKINNGQSPLELIKKIEALPGVKAAYPNYARHGQLAPNDSLYNLQKPYLDLLNMQDAWDIEIGSNEVVVAIIDTGCDPDHPELKANLIPGHNTVGSGAEPADFIDDDSGHGTAVAGVIGAVGNNAQGVAGIAWNVKLMPIRACWGEGLTCSIWDEVEAIDIARTSGVDLINMSIGGLGTISLEEQAATDAWDAGITMFAAAGNKNLYMKKTGTPADRQNLYYPASLPEVIGVGAVNVDLTRASFSNYGEVVSEIYAPGVEIISTIPTYPVFLFPGSGPPYGKIDGTSFSCPMATGAAVLLKSHFPELGPADIMARLFTTAIPLGNTDADHNGVDDNFGHGLLNPVGALAPPTQVSSEYFDLGVTSSPIFEDDVYIFVKVKKTIEGAPVVSYNIGSTSESGVVPMNKVGTGSFYMGSFNTTHNGQLKVSVSGTVGGQPLPPLELFYIISDF